MKEEDRKKGAVSFSTYIRYCKAAGGYCVSTGVVLLLVVIVLLRVFTDVWLGRWIDDGNGNSVRGSLENFGMTFDTECVRVTEFVITCSIGFHN